MNRSPIRFIFATCVSMEEAEGTLRLSMMAAEILHGSERVELEANTKVDASAFTIDIDRSSEVGQTIALIFLGYCRREFGRDAFTIRGIDRARQSEGAGPIL